ncbi:MAG: hypothetical protein AAB074_21525 [Planctomycetota bacterium]
MNRLMLAAAAVLALAASVLAEDPPPKTEAEIAQEKVDALILAMKDGTDDEKTVAIAGCGLTPHALTANALAPLLANPADDIRTKAVAALSLMKGVAEAATALESGFTANEEKSPIFLAILRAIEAVALPSSIAVLKSWIDKQLKKKETATLPTVDAAIESLAGIRHKKSVEALMLLLKGIEDRAGKPAKGSPPPAADLRVIAALARLTGQRMQQHPLWVEWWKKNEAKYNDDMTKVLK